jgi:hypothetical protein
MLPPRSKAGCRGTKGKLTGAKPPLRPKHVWSIRTKLQIEGRARDFAMFNLAIDSKLRGCDVVAIRVEDVATSGYTADRATVRQKKTGRPVRFELSEQTRQAIDDFLKAANKRPGEFLFTGRRGPNTSITTDRQRSAFMSFVNIWMAFNGWPTPADLVTYLRDPLALQLLTARAERTHHGFGLGERTVVAVADLMHKEMTTDTVAKLFSVDPKWVRKESDAVTHAIQKAKKGSEQRAVRNADRAWRTRQQRKNLTSET